MLAISLHVSFLMNELCFKLLRLMRVPISVVFLYIILLKRVGLPMCVGVFCFSCYELFIIWVFVLFCPCYLCSICIYNWGYNFLNTSVAFGCLERLTWKCEFNRSHKLMSFQLTSFWCIYEKPWGSDLYKCPEFFKNYCFHYPFKIICFFLEMISFVYYFHDLEDLHVAV